MVRRPRERAHGREDARKRKLGTGTVHCKAFMNERGPLYRGPPGRLHEASWGGAPSRAPRDSASPTSLVADYSLKISLVDSSPPQAPRSGLRRGAGASVPCPRTLPPARPPAPRHTHLSDALKSALAACLAAASARRFLDSSRIFFRAASNSSSVGFSRSSKISLVDSSPAQPCRRRPPRPVSPRPFAFGSGGTSRLRRGKSGCWGEGTGRWGREEGGWRGQKRHGGACGRASAPVRANSGKDDHDHVWGVHAVAGVRKTYADVGAGGGGAPAQGRGGARRHRHGPDARPGASAHGEHHFNEVEVVEVEVRACGVLKGFLDFFFVAGVPAKWMEERGDEMQWSWVPETHPWGARPDERMDAQRWLGFPPPPPRASPGRPLSP